jgi:glycosyltransferase involved in cell wall biosynthesis
MGDSPVAHWGLYWSRARQVLATEGWLVLLGKIQRRLRTTPARMRARPVLPALALQKEHHVRRRVLIVDTYMLTPDRESGSLRMLNLLTLLQELGFKPTFAALNLEAPEPYVSRLQQRGIEVLYRPYVKSLSRHLRACGSLYDLVILSRIEAGSRLLEPVRRHCPRAQLLYDTVDLHFLREARLAALTGSVSARAAAEQRKRQELDLIRHADQALVVSPYERDLLERELPGADVRIVSNIHALRGCQRGFEARAGVLFVGAFAHPPNTDAILWFCREVLPLVLREEPALCCSIIGADPPPRVRALASANVRVLGHVPDLEPYLDGCRLALAPLRYGAGVKGKISISLASGLPVVATPEAAEGMGLVHRESALIAATPAAFASALLEGYRDPALWHRLSEGGLAVMEPQFGFATARKALAAIVGRGEPESVSA